MPRGLKGKAEPVDIHVGSRLRLARLARDMTQSALGERLGITFQQIQKYEKGVNRLSGSRMKMAADALGVDVGYFFEGLPAADQSDVEPIAADIGLLDMKFMRRFSELKNLPSGGGKERRLVVDLLDLWLGEGQEPA